MVQKANAFRTFCCRFPHDDTVYCLKEETVWAMGRAQSQYATYLLRLWQASESGERHRVGRETSWRASVESPRTGGRTGFASLDELFAFLRERAGGWGRCAEDGQLGYLSYLLRLWAEPGDEGVLWHASLLDTSGGELQSFDDLDELFDYLREQISGVCSGRDETG
jgi:hypothetical protein